ncbi:MAG: folate-binding protein [Pseudomonadota bacterium]
MSYRFHDRTRAVLKLTGADAEPFLQNLVTNDVSKLSEGAVYAALLTPQGKYLADFILSKTDDGILLDADAEQVDGLMKRLTLYKLRADVTIEATSLPVVCFWGEGELPGIKDPRNEALGTRLYEMSDVGTPATEADYNALCVANAIPRAGRELRANESFILEMGFEALNGVDFRKGCYVGQEVTARMKHKTKLRKGLSRVAVEGDAAPGTEILSSDGRAAGVLHSQAGGEGLAYLRFDRAEGEMQAGDATLRRLP